MTNFDLADDPWIACTDLNGVSRELGLRGVLAKAHELRCLANESPLVDAAVLRLLLAIVHHALEGPVRPDDWKELRQRGRFDEAVLDRYFAKRREQFGLFSERTPFYQVPGLIEQSPTYARGQKPAREMIAEQSAYGAPRALFESRPSDDISITPATAARWLVALQAFHPGGLLTRDTKNGDPTSVRAAPLCAVAVVTVRGATLFETLVLNLVPYPDPLVFSSDKDDLPAWDRDPQMRSTRRACRGWLDWLTWQSRRVQLIQDDTGNVTRFLLLAGTDLVSETMPVDPMCAYRVRDPKLGRQPIAFSEDRAIWRDSEALFQIHESRDSTPARVITALTSRRVRAQLQLQLYGQVPNRASLVLSATEVVPLPSEFFDHPDLVGHVREQLETAENVQKALRGALFLTAWHVLSIGDRKPESREIGTLVDGTQAIPRFWAALKPAFEEFLLTLPAESDRAVADFRAAAVQEARTAFDRAAGQLAGPGRVLKGVALGRTKLESDLGPITRAHQQPAIQTLPHEGRA